MNKIEIKNLYKDYIPGEHAVENFSLSMEQGEFIVLVGPSGCGKSTTLRMIAGLEDITSGDVYINGEKMTHKHPKDRDIAMVFQNYALYPHMTVEENMAFGLKMKKVDKEEREQRVREAAKIIGLEDYLDRLPKELSGGQRQRVALGRAIVRKSNVFLMDEPLSNLDAKLRIQTRAEISQLSKRLNTSTIYVTHDQVEAMTMADRIVILDQGIIQQIGTPKEVYLKPENHFVAGFIGSPAMNFMTLSVEDEFLNFHGNKIILPDFITDYLRNHYLNQSVIFGIRPENILLASDVSDPESLDYYPIEATVEVAEMLGSETLLHFDFYGERLIAKVNTLEEFIPGEKVNLLLDLQFGHFFDTTTQRRIEIDGHGKYNEILRNTKAKVKVGEQS